MCSSDLALRNPDPKLTADRLIELALRGGGPDNITVIVADVVDIDFGEDDPIVGGAAGDGSDAETVPPNSSAARAATTTLPRVAPQRIEPRMESPPRKKGRAALIVLSVLIVLVGATALARLWVMQQYYVGARNDQLVIFQGVHGSVLGIPLQTQRESSCPSGTTHGCEPIKLGDLQEDARIQVAAGIQSTDGLAGARGIVQRLRTQKMLPPCPAEPAAGKPAGQPRPGQPGQAVAGQPPGAALDPTANPPQETPIPQVQLEPGKTCRPVS